MQPISCTYGQAVIPEPEPSWRSSRRTCSASAAETSQRSSRRASAAGAASDAHGGGNALERRTHGRREGGCRAHDGGNALERRTHSDAPETSQRSSRRASAARCGGNALERRTHGGRESGCRDHEGGNALERRTHGGMRGDWHNRQPGGSAAWQSQFYLGSVHSYFSSKTQTSLLQ